MCSDIVMALLRSFLLVFLLASGGAAEAGSIHVSGTAGFISEWALSGDLTEAGLGSQQFSGSLTWKHVGLCSSHGAEEKFADIKLQVSRPGSAPRVVGATLQLEGIECNFSESSRLMDCADGNRVPLTLSIDDR
jgi:hypothetical protein